MKTSIINLKKTAAMLAAMLPAVLFAQSVTVSQHAIAHMRPYDQSGINVFEPSKTDTQKYDGMKMKLGVGFTQQFQWLSHSNTALPKLNADGVNTNQLADIGPGFNNATANFNIDAQLTDGIRINVIQFLSARHHQETWVKGGYIQIDKLAMFKSHFIDNVMKYVTIKVGHGEINYGDAHLRRTDNGNALWNPFVGNYILDAYTTEIGGELYVQSNGFMIMGGVSGGESAGTVMTPQKRNPCFYGKVAVDEQIGDDLRLRLSASLLSHSKSMHSVLYRGDRAGSRYYMAMENTLATTSANAWSGEFDPGFASNVTAFMINPFVQFHGLEVFGTYERANGRTSTETQARTVDNKAIDVIYRFLKNKQLYVAGRYEHVQGQLVGIVNDVSEERWQVAAGWFITPNLEMKAEYVRQQYFGFPSTNILNGGEFHGAMVEASVGF